MGEEFIGDDNVCLVLGDNIFQMKIDTLTSCQDVKGGIVFGYHVNDPERYGVVEFDENFKALSLEEKPENLNQIMLFQGFIIMIIQLWRLLRILNLLQEESTKLRM